MRVSLVKKWLQAILYLVFTSFTLLIVASASAKPILIPNTMGSNPQNDPPPMDYQPPRDAERFEQFVPPGVEITRLEASIGQETSAPLNLQHGDAFSLFEDRLGVILEKDTINEQNSQLRITPRGFYEPGGSPGAETLAQDIPEGSRQYREAEELARFKIEIREIQQNREVTDFSKQARIVVDLRERGYDIANDGGAFYLAFQDPENEGRWIEVPITVHQSTGLISAEIPHFSDWATGWRPEGWTLQWEPPSANGFSGAATYQHGFEFPPGRNGLQPNFSLSYSNSALNGAMRYVAKGNVGSGWSTTQIAVVRTGVELNAGGSAMVYPSKFRLVINGSGHKLVQGSAEGGGTRYYVENAPSIRVIEYGGYWVATTGDGTQYRMGYTANSKTNHQLDYNGTPKGLNVIEWHVDTVTDTFGNQITYHYDNSLKTEHNQFSTAGCGGVCTYIMETFNSRVQNIYYNFSTKVGSNPVPHTVGRLNVVDAATRIEFEYGSSGYTITKLKLYHNTTEPYREYEIVTSNLNMFSGDCTGASHAVTKMVDSIIEHGYADNSSGVRTKYSLPAVTFEYENRGNYTGNVTIDGSTSTGTCFEYQHLKKVFNGYGAETEFVYSDDARQKGTFSNSGGFTTYPDLSRSHYVTTIFNRDGMGNSQKIEYVRTQACYNQTSPSYGPECGDVDDAPEFGTLFGFDNVETKIYNYEDTSVLRKEVTDYLTIHDGTGIDRDWFGRPETQQVFSDSTLLSETTNGYSSLTFGNNTKFVVMDEQISKQFDPNGTQDYLYSKTEYQYDAQYGNLTNVKQFIDESSGTPYQETANYYAPNTTNDHWIVNKLWGDVQFVEGNLVTGSWNYYDGATADATPPTQGFLTYTRQWVPLPDCSYIEGGASASCVNAYQTIEQSFVPDAYGNALQSIDYQNFGYRGHNSNNTVVTDNVPATGTRTTTILYESEFNLYPVRMTTPASLLTTEFEIYGFKNVAGSTVALNGFQATPGLLKAVEDPNGNETKYEYDPFGRLFAVYDEESFTGFGNLNQWDGDPVARYRYWDTTWNSNTVWLDPTNNEPFMISVDQRPGTYTSSTDYIMQTVEFYDGFGRPIQSQTKDAEIQEATSRKDLYVTTAYNALGQVSCSTVQLDKAYVDLSTGSGFETGSCETKDHTETLYDALSRPTQVIPPQTSLTTYYYYAIDDVETTEVVSRVATVDANGHALTHMSNVLGQLVQVREYTGTGPHSTYADTLYTYDDLGNLHTVTHDDKDAATINPITTINYDNWSRKTSMVDPDMGEWHYQYDAPGNLLRQQDANFNVICFNYDSLDRLTHKAGYIHSSEPSANSTTCPTSSTFPTSGENHLATYIYDTATNGNGQLHQIKWGPLPEENKDIFSYDDQGRMYKQERFLDGRSYVMETLSFDELQRPLTVQYPNQEEIHIEYDHEGETGLTLNTTPIVNDIAYNAQGRLALIDRAADENTIFDYHGATGPNGNNNFRLERIRHGDPIADDDLVDFTYSYDPIGNITEISSISSSGSEIQSFVYDHLNRLTAASADNGLGASYSETYTYYENGNIKTFDGANYGYSSTQPHAVIDIGNGAQTFDYDANGNMILRDDTTGNYIQYFDLENRLVDVLEVDNGSTTGFFYDPSGQRTKTVQPDGTITYYPFPDYEETIEYSDPVGGYYWSFDEGAGSIVANFSTPRLSGNVDGPNWVTGHSGTGLSFDGSNDRVQIIEDVDIDGALTVSAWVYPTGGPTTTSRGAIVVTNFDWDSNSTNNKGWTLGDVISDGGSDGPDHFEFRVWGDQGTVASAFYNGFFAEYHEQWVHVAGVYRPGQAVELYFDGVLVHEDTTSVPSQLDVSNILEIGSRADNTTQGHWTGTIDEVRIIGEALSAQEISDLMNLIAFPLNNDNGQPAIADSQVRGANSLFAQTKDKTLTNSLLTAVVVLLSLASLYFFARLWFPVILRARFAHSPWAVLVLIGGVVGTFMIVSLVAASSSDETASTNVSQQAAEVGSRAVFSSPSGVEESSDFELVFNQLSPVQEEDSTDILENSSSLALLPAAATTHTFTPTDDAFTDGRSGREDTNSGSWGGLQMKGGDPRRPYLKFDVQGISGTVVTTTLRLYASHSSNSGAEAWLVDDGWAESTITHNNQPTSLSQVGTITSFGTGWVDIDVTGAVTTTGEVSLMVDGIANEYVYFDSSENPSGNGPELIVETDTGSPPPTSTPTETPIPTNTPTATPTPSGGGGDTTTMFSAEADAFTKSSNPTQNTGNWTSFQTDGNPEYNSYIRFDAQGLTGTVVSATLRLYADHASTDGVSVWTVENNWVETTITHNTGVPADIADIADSGNIAIGWVEIDVTSAISGNGQVSFKLEGNSGDRISWRGRTHNSNNPELVVVTDTTSATATPTPTDTPVATETPTAIPSPTPTNTPVPPSTDYTVTQKIILRLAGQPIAVRTIVEDDAQVVLETSIRYILTDHLGSISQMLYHDTGDAITGSTAQHFPFGDYRTQPTNDDTDLGFTGHRHNDDIGLIYMNARFYVDGIGRFASADTIVPDPGNPQAWNRYSYTINNPLVYTDPSGHCFTPDGNAISAGCYIAAGGLAGGTLAVGYAVQNDLITVSNPFPSPNPRPRVEDLPDSDTSDETVDVTVDIDLDFDNDNDEEEYVTFMHLTTAENAINILSNGIQPIAGPQSGNDLRFFSVTQESGPFPRPTTTQVTNMLSDIATQLSESHPDESLALVHILIPKNVVNSLESEGTIHYGPFFPASAPGFTESIFEVSGFSIINSHQEKWFSIPVD